VSFQAAITELCESCPGSVGAAIVDPDGIPVAVTESEVVLEDIGAEFAAIVQGVEEAERELRHGSLRQLIVCTNELALILTLMGGGYFLLLLLHSDGLLGKGRFLSRLVGERLYDEFI
jgi:predicted regulator of Ras-like GTPase activity (Roadblock/LC7/MglB family)